MTVAEIMKWYEQWSQSEEAKAYIKKIEKEHSEIVTQTRSHHFLVEDDGSFKILDVLPGEYELSAQLRKPDEHGYPDHRKPVVAEIKHKFTVADITEENQDIPIELGTIEFSKAAGLEVNEPAPDFSVRTLDGGTLSLADLRGKYVLLTFYMLSGSEGQAADFVPLKQIQDDFAKDERFEMVGLTYGGMPLYDELFGKFLSEQGLTWRQGMLDASSYELIQTYKIRSWPDSFLIDPNGILLEKDLKGEKAYQAVADALKE